MKLSIIIPAFGRQKALDMMLSTLMNQTVHPHEIVVVDDGSPDAIVVPADVRLIRIGRSPAYRGSSEAKNVGARHATGDHLAFSDADILHMPDAIESVLKRHSEMNRDDALINVFSVAVTADDLSNVGWEQGNRRSMEKLMAHFKATDGLHSATVQMNGKTHGVASKEQHFGFINREYFQSIGGYDADSFKSWGYNNQDLCMRIQKLGGELASDIYRVMGGDLLHCFHNYEDYGHCDKEARDREFYSKYGTDYYTYKSEMANV